MNSIPALRVLGKQRLRIVHRTQYRFAEPLHECELRVYLEPLETLHQHVIRHDFSVGPTPDSRWESHDDHGNLRSCAALRSGVRHVDITAVSTVEVARHPTPAVVMDCPWEAIAELSQSRHFWPYLLPSIGIPSGAGIDSYAQVSFREGHSLGEALHTLLLRLRRDFEPGTPPEADPRNLLGHRRGRAQDMTNFLVACLRAMGLPTRYVRGYRVHAASGETHLHCWASVWTGDGWLDVDAAQRRVGRLGHIEVARGRDAAELAPVTLRTEGGGQCWRQTEVLIREPGFDLPCQKSPAA